MLWEGGVEYRQGIREAASIGSGMVGLVAGHGDDAGASGKRSWSTAGPDGRSDRQHHRLGWGMYLDYKLGVEVMQKSRALGMAKPARCLPCIRMDAQDLRVQADLPGINIARLGDNVLVRESLSELQSTRGKR